MSRHLKCLHSHFLPPITAREVSTPKRPRLLTQLAVPYHRLSYRNSSFRLRQKIRQVFPKSNGVDSEQSSVISSDGTSDLTDVTPDFTDVTSDITDLNSVPPSPRVLKNVEQGTLGVVVRGREGRMLGSILVSLCCVLPLSLVVSSVGRRSRNLCCDFLDSVS